MPHGRRAVRTRKRGLAGAYLQIAETVELDVLLLAHGDPLVGGAREALRAFAAEHAAAAP